MFDYHDMQTVAVDLAGGAGDTTVLAATAGVRWGILCLVLAAATASSTLIVKSGATAITGSWLIPVDGIVVGDGRGIVLLARAANEAIVMDPGATDIDGFVHVVTLRA